MSWSDAIKDYFTFTRKERIGLIIVLILIVVVFFLPLFFNDKIAGERVTRDTAWINAINASGKEVYPNVEDPDENETGAYQFDTTKAFAIYNPAGKPFSFDPNTLSVAGWRQLGLRDKTIQIIINFRSKGGQFKKTGDLQRIYGLSKKEYERLAPYANIQLPSNEKIPATITNKTNPSTREFSSGFSFLDINTADTTAFIELPGIGSKLAGRIVNFRNKLGGFYSIQQVGETFGLHDSTFQKIKPYLRMADSTVRKFNINSASADELKTHPYIRWPIANAIVAYRQEHGVFTSIEDIRKIMVITNDDYKRISPYLAL